MAIKKNKTSPRNKLGKNFGRRIQKGKRFDINGNVIGKVRVVSGGKADGNK